MACDVRCVATDVGDSAEIIGDSGLIVPLRDPQALANAWRALLDQPQLKTESARSRVASRYSLRQMCAQYEAVYRSISAAADKRARSALAD
jgi:glycosyltransferase involved in cell wall biosynthesis